MTPTDLTHLRQAIVVARRARDHGNHPFGAVLVDGAGNAVLEAENSVVTGRDCTGHAETNLVRMACGRLSPEQRAGCTLYTSTEPCAMCAGAIHWSGIARVVFALSESDLNAMVGPDQAPLRLPCREVFARAARAVEVSGPSAELETEARAVHEGFW